METMRAFHSDPKIKTKYLRRVAMHRRLDHLTQGVGWEKNGVTRGCAVGCTLEAYDHKRYPIELGVPEQIAHLEDRIFEGLPRDAAMQWPSRFLKAIPVGADLSGAWPAFVRWMLADPKHGVRRLVTSEAPWANQVRAAIDGVVDLYASGRYQDRDAAAAAADAAAYASAADAYAAAACAAADAAAYASAADAYAAAAACARAYAACAAGGGARAADAYQAASDALCEILAACPVGP